MPVFSINRKQIRESIYEADRLLVLGRRKTFLKPRKAISTASVQWGKVGGFAAKGSRLV